MLPKGKAAPRRICPYPGIILRRDHPSHLITVAGFSPSPRSSPAFHVHIAQIWFYCGTGSWISRKTGAMIIGSKKWQACKIGDFRKYRRR
jgi:hypothetical protein